MQRCRFLIGGRVRKLVFRYVAHKTTIQELGLTECGADLSGGDILFSITTLLSTS